MAPITHWMKDILHTRASVYIPRETLFGNIPGRASADISFTMSDISDQASIKSTSLSPVETGDNPHYSTTWPHFINKYQLWGKKKRSASEHQRQTAEEPILPLQQRSPSAMSDTHVTSITALPPLARSSSLLRRRKISVPELRQKPAPENFEAPLIDSRMSCFTV